MTFGGIEAGGSKWVCAIGGGPDDLRETIVIPTTTPDETIGRAADFLADGDSLAAVGVGSFGPVDLRAGRITTTPKPGWADVDVVERLRGRLDVPIAFDTDVNAAALGEHRWGAAVGLDTFCYVTVGTGIGGGGMVNGRLIHGLIHPELGHMRVPHDHERDPFEGVCPYHGDCLEGLASGRAMQARRGRPATEIDDDDAWELEADYLAFGIFNLISVLSPQRIVVGGGVARNQALLPLVRTRVHTLAAGYFAAPELDEGLDEYIVPPVLDDRAGVLGAIELARRIAP
jgi:predicted NBD/HSP70 family sugar kinase